MKEAIANRLIKCKQIVILGILAPCIICPKKPTILRPSYSSAYRMAFAVPTPHKPLSMLGFKCVYFLTFGTNSPSTHLLRARRVKLLVTGRKVNAERSKSYLSL